MEEILENVTFFTKRQNLKGLDERLIEIADAFLKFIKTGKKSLIGLFNSINAKSVPTAHPSLNVYITLTEGHGSYEGKLRCLIDNNTVLEIGGPLTFKHPRQIAEWNFTLRNLPLPKFGEYRFELLCDEKPVISRKFKVSPIK